MMSLLVTITDQRAVTTSPIIAESFGKKHEDVLRSISRLECSEEFNQRNFSPVGYTDTKGGGSLAYNVIRDGLTFLAMELAGIRGAEPQAGTEP